MISLAVVWSVSADSKIARFEKVLMNTCKPQNINKLLIKKVLIELINGEDCTGKFTSILLAQCEKVKCNGLQKIYLEVEQVRSGAVVGD